MADYQASYKPATEGTTSSFYEHNGDSGSESGSTYTPGTAASYGMAMPDRSKFEGADNWTQQTTLTPEAQRALNAQLKMQADRSELAGSFIDRVRSDLSQPFNWGSLPEAGKALSATEFERVGAAPTLRTSLDTSANAAERMRIENALFDRMRPIHEQQQSALDAKLANQGITAGSSAYGRSNQSLGDQQSRERFNALEIGGNEMQRLFGMQLQEGQFENTAKQNQQGMNINTTGFNNNVSKNRFSQNQAISEYQNRLRQQAVAEQTQQRQMALNEMNALLTGQQVSMPNMPQFNSSAAAQPVQYNQAAQSQYQANMDAFNAQNMGANSFMSGAMGLAGSLGGAGIMAFSDSRLKRIIKRVGEVKGVPLYLFKYLGSDAEHIGPKAQEVQKIHPELVKRHANGYLMVNYSKLMEA